MGPKPMITIEEFVQQALALPKCERADLVSRLIRTLDEGDASEDEAAEAWMDEAQRRAEAVDRGEMEARDWDSFHREIKARLS